MIDRDYLDYNATSPLSSEVISSLGKGDFPFANPSSIHTSGKNSRLLIDDCSESVLALFGLGNFHIVYHSGATEGINSIFSKLTGGDALVYSSVDHPCVLATAKNCKKNGVEIFKFSVESDGKFNKNELIKKIKELKAGHKKVWLNYTVANNETGVIWPLELAIEIKEQTGCFIHVDAVQLIRKISKWNNLSEKLDAYSFSSHKFGGLKSFGFTLFKNKNDYGPIILGGGQQEGLRAGTENPLGVFINKVALEQSLGTPIVEIESFRNEIEQLFKSTIGEKGFIVAEKSERLSNTSLFIFKGHNADFSLAAFDIAGLEVSMGSACSSGSLKQSRILTNMNISENQNGIRISLGPENLSRKKEILIRLEKVLSNLYGP